MPSLFQFSILTLPPALSPFAGWFRSLVGVIENMSLPMSIVDTRLPSLPLVYVNSEFCSMTGYSRAEVLGRNCRLLQGERTSRLAVERIRQAIRASNSAIVRITNYKRSGKMFDNLLLLRAISDGHIFVRFMVGLHIESPQTASKHAVSHALSLARLIPHIYHAVKTKKEDEVFTHRCHARNYVKYL